MDTNMRNAGTVEFRGRKIPVQVVGRQVYISGYPAEQYPRELRSRAIALARSPVAVSMVAVKTTPARARSLPSFHRNKKAR